jgi:hypothetical protein
MRERLSAHAVLLPRASEFELVLTGKLNRVAYVVLTPNIDDTENRRLIEVTRVVREAAALFEGDRRRIWFRNENCGIFLNGIWRENEVASLRFEGSSGVIKYFLGGEKEYDRTGDKNRQEPASRTAHYTSRSAAYRRESIKRLAMRARLSLLPSSTAMARTFGAFGRCTYFSGIGSMVPIRMTFVFGSNVPVTFTFKPAFFSASSCLSSL